MISDKSTVGVSGPLLGVIVGVVSILLKWRGIEPHPKNYCNACGVRESVREQRLLVNWWEKLIPYDDNSYKVINNGTFVGNIDSPSPFVAKFPCALKIFS